MGAALSNVPTFGMCSNPANPTVASATAAAMGVLTPMPCVPATVAWAPGCPTVTVCKRPLLNSTSKLTCSYGGVIQCDRDPGHDGEGAVRADRRQRGGLGHGGVRPAGRFL